MREAQLLDETMALLEREGAQSAYDHLLKRKDEADQSTSQTYNFLYCLAALCGKREEALAWMQEAVIEKAYWYRPEVFEDGDLDSLRGDLRFDDCRKLSEKRYLDELGKAKTICTWNGVKSPNILLALHGNQQNIGICREQWDFLHDHGYQVEYVQSRELDSHGLYRWEDDGDGDLQLKDVIASVEWESYAGHGLCGFSSGCNVILKAMADGHFPCEQIVLQSPWIPVVYENMDRILHTLKENRTRILMVCGKQDSDCAPLAEAFADQMKRAGIPIQEVWIKELSHGFPENFKEIIRSALL